MNVLLIYPAWPGRKKGHPYWMPLGLSHIAACLTAGGHCVRILDRYVRLVVHGHDMDALNAEMIKEIRTFRPDIIGLNTISPVIYDTVDCVRRIRQVYNGILIAGGHHASALPEVTLKRLDGLNGVVQGEGEIAMSRLADGEDPFQIPGIWYKNGNGRIRMTPPRQIEDLDRLPFPDFKPLDMEFYTRRSLYCIRGHYLSTLSMMASRGCPHACSFCTESLTYGNRIRFHSLDYVMEWLKKIDMTHPSEGIYFHDNDFLVDMNRAVRFCERFMGASYPKRYRWCIQTRANRIHRRTARLLKRAGCVLVELGVETPLQHQLNNVGKGLAVRSSERAVRFCRQERLKVHVNIIVGFPNETIDDLNFKLDWIKRLRPDSFDFFPLSIHPGSRLYVESGNRFFEREEWSEDTVRRYYQGMRMSDFNREEFRRWQRHFYMTYRRWQARKLVVRSNSPYKLAGLLSKKGMAKAKRIHRRLARL